MSEDEGMSAFLDLHRPGDPLLMPNPWDLGSARLLQSLGFQALATTSSGFAATLGRLDGRVTRDEALGHAAAVAGAVGVPVSADLENGFADDPEAVAEAVRLGREIGLAGCSIEDWDGAATYDAGLAAERVHAAVEAAGDELVVTARADGLLHGGTLHDVIDRLQRFQEAGAPVLYAPGLATEEQVAAVLGAVDRPVTVLARAGLPPMVRLAELGVARISVGGAFAYAAYAGMVDAARELLAAGTYGYAAPAAEASRLIGEAFPR